MFRRLRYLLCTILAIGLFMAADAQDGCVNTAQYPGIEITPDPSGAVTPVSTCIFLQEFTHYTGIVSGSTYKFTINGNGYITLRSGASDGPMVMSGYDYLIYTAASNDDLFAHYTVDENCATATNCQENTVQLMLNCIPPMVGYEWIEDCSTGEFMVQLDFIDLGDSPGLTVEYTIDGTAGTISPVSVGTVDIGPVVLGQTVDINVVYGGQPDCDIVFSDLQPFSGCPFELTCGAPATNMSYCYNGGDNVSWYFQGQGTGSIRLDFVSGMIGGGDFLTIHDGPDATSPILFEQLIWADLDLAGTTIVSSGPEMFMTLVADAFSSCSDSIYAPIEWNVACLDCTLPQAEVTIVEDCPNNQYTIQVNVTSAGDGNTVDIEYAVNDGTPQTVTGAGIGQTDIGPFTINDQVAITLQHENDGMCDVSLGTFTDSGACPTIVTCGAPDVLEAYCYGNGDSQFWFYQLEGTGGSLFLTFTSGTIESNFFDNLAIHDGVDGSAPIIWQHTSEEQFDLTGVAVTSTSGSLFMTMSSDGSSSCDDQSQTEWNWTLTCLDCSPAIASYNIVQDCPNFQYFVDVVVTEMGSDPEITVTNDGGAAEATISAPGTVQIGPFVSGTPVQITLVNDSNALCNAVSDVLVNPLCPQIICGTTPFQETYCYDANENMAWAYEVSGNGNVHLVFDIGTIESDTWDDLTIYDGPDAQSPILFQHLGGTSELGPDGSAVNGDGFVYYGVDVTSTGQNLYMTLTSDGSVQCSSMTNFDPWEWNVSCEGCDAPGVSYSLEADCEHLLYKVAVNVTELTGPLGLQITEMSTGETVTATSPNTFLFNTIFGLDSISNFQVVDLDNEGCTYESGPMIFTRDSCVINSCGLDNYEVCYENNEDRWYTYRSVGNVPVAIFFYEGQMLSNDMVTLYNGLVDQPGNIIFSGNNSGNLTGLTVNSNNTDNALTLRIRSNDSGSCSDESATVPLRWDVGCGFVGIDEVARTGFSIFPNPSTGILNIDLGSMMEGEMNIRVTDMSGRIAAERTVLGSFDRTSLDLGQLQNGQYMVTIVTENWTATKPLQLMR